jgi:hypothetical protein
MGQAGAVPCAGGTRGEHLGTQTEQVFAELPTELASTDPGHPTSIPTAGHAKRRIRIRRIVSDTTPERPTGEVVRVAGGS